MTKGTERAPVRLFPQFSKNGNENLQIMLKQLEEAGVAPEDIARFTACVHQLRKHHEGQIHPLTEAAHAIHVEVHWVN